MNAPVDVLAVLRRASRDVSNEDFVAYSDAVDAIAELIEAANEHARNTYSLSETNIRLRAALAAVGVR